MSVREIADFAAHPDLREKGPVSQVVPDLITTFTPVLDRALGSQNPPIEKVLDRVVSNFRMATDEQLFRICGLSRSAKIVDVGLAKMRKGEGELLTSVEGTVLSGLGDRLIWNPVFRGDEIFADF